MDDEWMTEKVFGVDDALAAHGLLSRRRTRAKKLDDECTMEKSLPDRGRLGAQMY